MKIALVHDFLLEFGGAERVLFALKKIFPEADVFVSYYDPDSLGEYSEEVKRWHIKTSWADKVPFMRRLHSPLRFLYPFIWKSFDFSGYDLVISSCNHFSKGIYVEKPTCHICYLHHPPRYLYGYKTTMEWQKYWPIKIYAYIINHFLRIYDFKSSKNPDFYIANSQETKRRIKKFYRRDGVVIYPPMTFAEKSATDNRQPQSYFITVSRLARAKNVDILIKAANKRKFALKIVGRGRDEKYLRSIAGSSVEFLKDIVDEKLSELLSGAKAFLFAAQDEEFGIAPVEAMGYGAPVIAYKSGGLIETVKQGKNGFLFDKLTVASLILSINKLNNLGKKEYGDMCRNARAESEKYSYERFEKEIMRFVEKNLSG